MTKNKLNSKLKMMVNFATLAKQIGDEITKELEPCDALYGLLNEIQDCERSDIAQIMSELENNYDGLLYGVEDGEKILNMEVHYDSNGLEIVAEANDGAFVLRADDNSESLQASINFLPNDNHAMIDVSMAEIAKKNLANTYGLPKDNKDIFVYTYGNVYQEDYTNKTVLKHEDIMEALKEDIDREL